MVSSEDLLAFVREKADFNVKRDSEGQPELANVGLEGEPLAEAIQAVAELARDEAKAELAKREFDAHMQLHKDELDRRAMGGPPAQAHGNYN